MSDLEKHNMLHTARIRALVFLSSTLLLLGISKAFEQNAFPSSESATIAHLAHIQACKVALLPNSQQSDPDTHRPFQNFGHGGLIIPSFSNPLYLPFSSTRASGAIVFTPNVKRCILFSCQRIGDPPIV